MSGNSNGSLACTACGADPTTMVIPNEKDDDCICECGSCGQQFGRWGDIKDQAMKAATADAKAALKNLKF